MSDQPQTQTQTQQPSIGIDPQVAYEAAVAVSAEYATEIADRRVRELLLINEVRRLQQQLAELTPAEAEVSE